MGRAKNGPKYARMKKMITSKAIIPGVPIMYITQYKYSIERLPEATVGGGLEMSS
ncbi:rRNA-processing protein [Salix suchowensis]|nr:rRNA-processing protein [Salix suchowensis]